VSTDRQVEANRQNAQKSTGPNTPEGKAAVRLNGLKHGLAAETVVVPGEDPAQFQALLDDYVAEYQPATLIEESLVRQFVMAEWRLLRLHRMESAFYNLRHKREMNVRLEYHDFNADERLAFSVNYDAGPQSLMLNLHRYELRLERSAKNARQELDRRLEVRRANQTQSAHVAPPKAQPSPKIISIETTQRPSAQASPAPEPPPSPLPPIEKQVPTAN